MADLSSRISDRSPPRSPMAGFGAPILQRHDFAGSVARFWQSSYAADYVGLTGLFVAWILMQASLEPFHRMFTLDDVRIQFPHAEVERVSVGMLFVYALAIPAGVIALWAMLMRPSIHKVHVTYLGFITSIFLTTFLTEIIKNGVGRPRPDLISRCRPASGTPEHVLVTYEVCTQPNHHTLHDGFRSFPSGHSSFAFSGLGFLSLLLASQTHVLHPFASLPALLVTIVPFFGALLIAISRCEDYRHDVWDVTAGSLLGLLIAWLTYRRYYPNLRSKHCATPYPSRSDMLKKYMKLQDEERATEGRNGRTAPVEPEEESEEEDHGLLAGGRQRDMER